MKRGRLDEVSHDQEGGRSGIVDEVGLEGAGEIEFGESLNGAGLKRYSENGEEVASKRIRVEEGLSEDYRVGTNSSVCSCVSSSFAFFESVFEGCYD